MTTQKFPVTTALLLGLLVTSPATATATATDQLAQGPAPWDHFVAVPVPDTSALKPRESQRLISLRKKLNEKIQQPPSANARPDLAEAIGTLCALYQVHDMRSAAEPCYRNAQILDPEDVRWFYYPAWLAMKSGRYEQALSDLERVRQLAPDHPTLNLRLGEAHYGLDQFDQALPFLNQALAEQDTQVQNQTRARAHWLLGQIALLNRDYKQALFHFQKALKAQPKATAIHYPLAQTYRALGQRDLALKHLKQRGKREPQAKDSLLEALNALGDPALQHFNQAMKAVLKRDYNTAAKEFSEGLALSPDNPHAQISFGRALMLTGQTDAARNAFKKAIEQFTQQAQDPSLAEFFLALSHHHSKDLAAARRHYQLALRSRPEQEGTDYFFGLLLRQSQDPGDQHLAATLLGKAADQDSQNSRAALQQLLALQQTGAKDPTLLKQLQLRLKKAPQNPALNYALVRLLALSKDPQVKDPERALNMAKGLFNSYSGPQMALLLALAQAANGQFESATQGYDKVITAARRAGRQTGRQTSQPSLAEALKIEQKTLIQHQLPEAAWPSYDPIFATPVPDTLTPFKEYPAAKPF